MKPAPEVLLVGGGISSMIAALGLLQRGRRVTILEANPRERLGGQCRDSFGGLLFVDTPEQRRVGAHDSTQLAWEDWQGYAEFVDGDPATATQQWWAKHYLERCVPEVRDWLIAQGVTFFPMANWAEKAHDGRGNRVPRFHLTWGCGARLVEVFGDALRPYQGGLLSIRYGHRVDRLLTEGGAVTGVAGRSTDDSGYRPDRWSDPACGLPFELRAEQVVIAAGGWTGNLDKVRAQWPRSVWGQAPQDLLCGVWPETDGTLHDQAAAAGAALAGMSDMWVYAAGVTHLRSEYPGHGLAIIPPKSGLWLDARGRRFDPPLLAGFDTRAAIARICAQEHPWSWMVLSRRMLNRELAIQGSQFNAAFTERSYPRLIADLLRGAPALAQDLIDQCPDVVSANDLSGLGQAMSRLTPNCPIDTAGLMEDIARYDQQAQAGRKWFTDPQLVNLVNVRSFLSDKLRTVNCRPIVDAHGGELVAVRLRPVARKSLGGIVTDQTCQALDGQGRAVPGLYAIGESAGFGGGGMNGKRTLEGTLLGGCVLTARTLAANLP